MQLTVVKVKEVINKFNNVENYFYPPQVRNADVGWKETKKSLRKDHRWGMADALSKSDKEALFKDHIESLNQRKKEAFRKLLDETHEVHVGWNHYFTVKCVILLIIIFFLYSLVGGTSAGFGKSSSKHSKSFRIILSNQKLAWALTSAPKAILPANTACCIATSGTKTAGTIPSRRQDFVINWYCSPDWVSCGVFPICSKSKHDA